MARVGFLLAVMGSAVTATPCVDCQFPSPWDHPEQREVVEQYFDLAQANNSISDMRLWSVPKLDSAKKDDFWPFLLQLRDDDQSKDEHFFTSKENTRSILDGMWTGKNVRFQVFDASTVHVFLKSSDVDDIYKTGYLKWCAKQKPEVKHLIRLPLATRIAPLATSNPSGAIQAYCDNADSCKVVLGAINKLPSANLDLKNFPQIEPKMLIACKDCATDTYLVEPAWCAPAGTKSRIGNCVKINKEDLQAKQGKNRISINFNGNIAELQTLQLYLANLFQVTYVSTTPRSVPLLASSARSVQGGGSHGLCNMLREHNLNGRGYTIGLVDMGIDMHSSFFVDADYPTPCSNNGDIKTSKDGTKYASGLTQCNNMKTKSKVFNNAAVVEVDETQYRYQPKSRKVSSIIVQEGSDGTLGSSHGTSVAAAINGFLSKDTKYQNCPLSYSQHRGIAYSSKLSLYDVGAYSKADGWSITTPDEDYTKMFSVAHKLGAHEFVVPFGAQSNGRYTPIADDIDDFMAENRDALVVVAAGNGGSISSPAVSKNALAVGAVNQAFTGPADFTSAGPSNAGLIKPDVLAPGSNVKLPINDPDRVKSHCKVDDVSGTSVSAGLIGGAATLVREYFEQGFYPSGQPTSSDRILNVSGASIKAVLVNSARQRPLVTKDGFTCKTTDQTGHGSVSLENSLPFADNHDYEMHFFESIAYGATCEHGKCYGGKPGGDRKVGPTAAEDVVFEFDIKAKNPSVPISATLTWIDPPAVRSARNKVVQNIQLEIVGPGGGVWKQQSFAQCNGVDHAFAPVENTQKVTVLSPEEKSVYTVRVRKKFVLDSQEFSVVITGGSVEKEDATSLVCCPEGSVATWAGCFGVDYAVLTVLCVIIGIVAVLALVLFCLNAKKKQGALKELQEYDE